MERLFIATPFLGNPHVAFLDSMLRLSAKLDIPWQFKHCAGDGIGKARDRLVTQFLASKCEGLLFIDGDMGFTAEDVKRIVSHDGVDMVSGCYPLKSDPPTLVVCRLPDAKPDARGLEEVWAAPTGFLFIRRTVFEQLRAATPDQAWKDDDGVRHHHFFNSRVIDGQLVSEDFAFCHDWRKIGGRIFVDYGVQLAHSGGKIYKF